MYSTWKSFHMGYSNVFQLNHDVCSVCVITMDKNALTYFPGLVVRVYLLYSKSKTVGKLKKIIKNYFKLQNYIQKHELKTISITLNNIDCRLRDI